MNLLEKHCVPCDGDTPALTPEAVQTYLKEVPGWEADEANKKISREFKFKDFKEAMMFINKVAEIANKENHHPDIYIFYNRVRLDLLTHAAQGLTENDFILAAKINALL